MTPVPDQQQQPIQPSPQEQREDRRATIQLLEIIAETELRQSYAKDLISAEVARDAFNQDYRLASVFAASGIFEDVKGQTKEQAIATAMTKIRLGRGWGINEADAMRFIFFQNGKPSIENELIAAKLQQAGWDWDIEWSKDAKGRETGCKLWAKRKQPDGTFKAHLDRNGDPVSVEFNLEMASKAMIWEKGKQIPLSDKWNYQSWPGDMYFSKAIARFKRRLAPGILSGAITREEADESAAPPDPSQGAQAATERKTEALAEKIRTKKEEKPAPAPAAVTGPAAVSAPSAVTIEADAKWQRRVTDTFLDELGAPEFSAVLHSVTGDASAASITSVNHEAVWKAMTAAKERAKGAKDLLEGKAAAPGDLF